MRRLHSVCIFPGTDVKLDVSLLNLDPHLEDDPEIVRLRQEMQEKVELRKQQLALAQKQKQEKEARKKNPPATSSQSSEAPLVNVGIVETVSPV